MKRFMAVVAVALSLPAVASAQERERGDQKRAPEAAARRVERPEARTVEHESQQHAALARRQRTGDAWIPPRAGVKRDGKQWAGPSYHARDLRLVRPWERGHWNRGLGSHYVWQLQGGNRERFGLGGGWFALAPVDNDYAGTWRWTDDTMVLYPDREHEGWYRAYNVRLGTYTHVRYLGDS